jgi:ABC transporter substrate binding protein
MHSMRLFKFVGKAARRKQDAKKVLGTNGRHRANSPTQLRRFATATRDTSLTTRSGLLTSRICRCGSGSAKPFHRRMATRTIPIVFMNVADPVGAGFVQSMAHPGGNITGFLILSTA